MRIFGLYGVFIKFKWAHAQQILFQDGLQWVPSTQHREYSLSELMSHGQAQVGNTRLCSPWFTASPQTENEHRSSILCVSSLSLEGKSYQQKILIEKVKRYSLKKPGILLNNYSKT